MPGRRTPNNRPDDSRYATPGHFYQAMSRLAKGMEDVVIAILGDSTGVTVAGVQTRWPYRLGQRLAPLYPAYTVKHLGWNDTGQNYDAANVLQVGTFNRTDTVGTTGGSATVTDTGITAADFGRPVTGAGIPANSYVGTVTPGVSFLLSSLSTNQVNVNATATATVPMLVGPRTLWIYNGSTSGAPASYSTTRMALQCPVTPHVVIVNYSHNDTNNGFVYRQAHYGLCRLIEDWFPSAGIVNIAQNPRVATDPQHALGLSRVQAVIDLSASEHYGLVDVCQAFLDTPNYAGTLLNPDGLHPNDAGGSPLWADCIMKHMQRALLTTPATPVRREHRRTIFAPDFGAVEGSPTLATVNAPSNPFVAWSFDQSTQQGILTQVDYPDWWATINVYVLWGWTVGSGYTSANNVARWEVSRARFSGSSSGPFSSPVGAKSMGLVGTFSAQAGVTSAGALNGAPFATSWQRCVTADGPLNDRPVNFRIRRIAADPLDTLAETAYILAMSIERAS